MASEGGGTSSASSQDITIDHNYLDQCARVIGHPGILISGGNTGAGPISKITLTASVVAETVSGQAYRAEGSYTAATVVDTGLSTSVGDLPTPRPTVDSVKIKDTTVLETRDPSVVPTAAQRGLYRVQVKRGTGAAFLQRFEYLLSRSPADLKAARAATPGVFAKVQPVSGKSYAIVLSGAPLSLPATLEGVTFEALRAGDLDGTLAWMWDSVDGGAY